LSRPFPSRHYPPQSSFVRVNGKIRAREVRLIGDNGEQLGVLAIGEALNMARARGVDLVEVAAAATPPVCRLVDFGKYRYEQSKKDKESKKHQHANRVKEIQLSANIDPHDFSVKLQHAIDFLCEDMKVKVSLRFRGREMAHQEYGFKKVNDLLKQITPYGHQDAPPKLIGKGINVMISPLPRNKRAKNPNQPEGSAENRPESNGAPEQHLAEVVSKKTFPTTMVATQPQPAPRISTDSAATGLTQNPFANLEIPAGE
jgi:translation initiation factor IF-3